MSTRQSEALAQFQANPRVEKIRLIVAHDSCPSCTRLEGEYEKGEVPDLPTLTCSHELGCRCFYEPRLTEIYP